MFVLVAQASASAVAPNGGASGGEVLREAGLSGSSWSRWLESWLGTQNTGGPTAWVQSFVGSLVERHDVAIAVAAGIVLALGLFGLVAGGRLARPMLASIAAGLGAVVGALLPGDLIATFGGGPEWRVLAMGAGVVIGGAVGAALFRPAMAVAGASAGGVAAAGVLTLMALLGTGWLAGGEVKEEIARESNQKNFQGSFVVSRVVLSHERLRVGEGFAALNDAIREPGRVPETLAADALKRSVVTTWERVPLRAKNTIWLSLIAGGLVGLIAGALWPRRVARFVASLLGASAVVAAGITLGAVAGVGLSWNAAEVAPAALIVWLALAIVGSMVQTARERTRSGGAVEAA